MPLVPLTLIVLLLTDAPVGAQILKAAGGLDHAREGWLKLTDFLDTAENNFTGIATSSNEIVPDQD